MKAAFSVLLSAFVTALVMLSTSAFVRVKNLESEVQSLQIQVHVLEHRVRQLEPKP